MSIALHAFTSYEVKGGMGYYEIHYENDEDYDIAVGNWHYIYTLLQYAEKLIGRELNIPIYDYIDDAEAVRENGMELTDVDLFIKGMEAVLTNIKQLSGNENPIICGHIIGGEVWRLYDADENKYGTYDEQKETIIRYAERILNWARAGLHFVEERQ